ncbi:MAG: hypothetical protein LBM66_04220 [Bifidobacteriaceae bacterium]|nr:hypothetical protein [Bifidobacteriaceae bacterium]
MSGDITPDAPEAPLEEVLDSYPVDPSASGIVIDPEITEADLSKHVEFSSDTPVSKQRQLRSELGVLSSGRAARSSQWSSFVIPPGGGWSKLIKSGWAFVGTRPTTKKLYEWKLSPGTNQSVCMRGQGHTRKYVGSSLEEVRAMYGLGCGDSGSAWVPWGEVMAYPKVSGRSATIVSAGTGMFH